MQVGIHANITDQTTAKLASALHPLFRSLAAKLQGEYGGMMEHLWIDLELVESHARPDGKPRHSFRLQKRVSGRGRFGLPAIDDRMNVGHYSVRPNFAHLAALPVEQATQYVLSLIYESTEVLLAKQKRLGGFDAQMFREKFISACQQLGFCVE